MIIKKLLSLFGFKFTEPNQGFRDNVKIGHLVSFGGNVFISGSDQVTIGDYTMIGYGTIIHTSTHDYNDHPMWSKRIDMPVKIGKHVWIGTGAIILPGVIIADHSVVGAGSVVNAHVPQGAIVAGNPARIIKLRDLNTTDLKDKEFNYEMSIVDKRSFLTENIICKEYK